MNMSVAGHPRGKPSAGRFVQQLRPPTDEQRMEGVGFSSCGRLIAVVASGDDQVFLYRRASPTGRFDAQPYQTLTDPDGLIEYPHDAAFSPDPDSRLLAVAQRTGSLLIYRRNSGTDDYGPRAAAIVMGAQSGLDYSDGVVFVPPRGDLVAACNLRCHSVSFYTVRHDGGSVDVGQSPVFVLTHDCIFEPDGLAISAGGEFLALANHGNNSVTVFRRGQGEGADRAALYGPDPVCVIRDRQLRYPHSVAFTPRGDHLLVTNAGANYVGLFLCNRYRGGGATWSRTAHALTPVADADVFEHANLDNKMEGGPKGIAARQGEFAVCSPQVGLKLFGAQEPDTIVSEIPVFGIGVNDRPRQVWGWHRQESTSEGTILVPPARRHRGRRRRVRLNSSSETLLQLCDGESTVGEIVDALRERFPDEPNLEVDVIQGVQALEMRGLVET